MADTNSRICEDFFNKKVFNPFTQYKDKREPEAINQAVSFLSFVKELLIFAKAQATFAHLLTASDKVTFDEIFDSARGLKAP